MENINWDSIHYNELDTILQIYTHDTSVVDNEISNHLTPLCLACKYNREDLVTILLHHGARIDKSASNCRKLPLHFACCHRDSNRGIVRKLLEAGADINAQDIYGNTGLHLACKKDNIPIAELLIEFGASVKITNVDGETPLLKACLISSVKLVDLLLKAGSDPNVSDGYALQLAVRSPSVAMCKLLTAAGADLNNEKRNYLNFACHYGTYSLIKALLENGAKVNRTDSQNRSPLHFACYADSNVSVRLLLEWGADVHACTDSGATALHIACDMLNGDNIKLLLDYGANVNAKDYQERTLLMKLLGTTLRYSKSDTNICKIVHLLIAAGCKCPQYSIADIRLTLLLADERFHCKELQKTFAQFLSEPQDLQSLCRIVIRKYVPPNVDENVEQLPLPSQIIKFLKFHDLL